MYKLSSLFFLFFSLGLFFLAVGNLTDKNDNNIEDISPSDLEKKYKTSNALDSKVHLKKEKDLNIDKNQHNLKEEQKSGQNLDKQLEKRKISQEKLKANDTKDMTFIQFGAFSEKKNAENIKEEIEPKIKNKFKEFKLKVISDEGGNIHKLIFKVKEINKAKEICNYSKVINIDCYVKKK